MRPDGNAFGSTIASGGPSNGEETLKTERPEVGEARQSKVP